MAIGTHHVESTEMKGDMTPMIDVVFQLLIFFMLTIKFKLLEGKLSAYLPKDVGVNEAPAEPKEKVEIKLKVEREGTRLRADDSGKRWQEGDGAFKYGPDRVIRFSVGPKSSTDLNEIVVRIKELYRNDKEGSVTIDPLPGTVYADVIRVLDEVVLIGYRDVSFVGDKSALSSKK